MTVTISNRATWWPCEALIALMLCAPVHAGLDQFQSRQLTPAGEYTFAIEGPAVDAKGNLYVVNFGKAGTIGMLPAGAAASKLFLTLPEGSIANSIRFDSHGRMFIADYKRHNIFVVEPGSTELKTYFHSDDFNQPNDMTVAADGTIYVGCNVENASYGLTARSMRAIRVSNAAAVRSGASREAPAATASASGWQPNGR